MITDQVMGGVSDGNLTYMEYQNRSCLKLSGQVSTKNNGGFIQISSHLAQLEGFNPSRYDGIRFLVAGNSETYNIHLRTSDLKRPWESYRASFIATADWQEISLGFDQFKAHRTEQPFIVEHLVRLGLVGIGRDFYSELYLANLSFFSSHK